MVRSITNWSIDVEAFTGSWQGNAMEAVELKYAACYYFGSEWGLASLLKIKAAICFYMGLHAGGPSVRLVLDPVRQPRMRPPGLASGGTIKEAKNGGYRGAN